MGGDGKLTTDTKSKSEKTADPLKTLTPRSRSRNKLTGELGAVQNRLESTIANLNNVVNNLSGARSRIQDADYATEVSNMSKNQILQQAGTSVLAQANRAANRSVAAALITPQQERPGRSDREVRLAHLARGPFVHSTKPAQAGFVLSSARAIPTTVPDLSQSPDRIPRGTGREKLA